MTHPYGRKQRGTKEPLMKVKEESENVVLKLNIQKTKIMASNPITSQQIEGEKLEAVIDFISLGSQVSAEELILLNYAGEDSSDSVVLQGDQTSQS